jgi:hypothetical protein
VLAAELTPGIVEHQDSINKASLKMPMELRTEEKLEQNELDRFHQELEANRRESPVFCLRRLDFTTQF